MDAGKREMWQGIDLALPELRTVIGELRTAGDEDRADRLAEATDKLALSRARAAREYVESAGQLGLTLREALAPAMKQIAVAARDADRMLRRRAGFAPWPTRNEGV